MAWTAPRTWVVGAKVLASQMNTHLRDNLLAIWPPIKVQGGQTTYPYYLTGGVVSVSADGSGNFSIDFDTAFDHAIVTAWCQSASGGSPFVVSIGTLDVDHLDCHASAVEGTDVTSVTLSVVYGAFGY